MEYVIKLGCHPCMMYQVYQVWCIKCMPTSLISIRPPWISMRPVWKNVRVAAVLKSLLYHLLKSLFFTATNCIKIMLTSSHHGWLLHLRYSCPLVRASWHCHHILFMYLSAKNFKFQFQLQVEKWSFTNSSFTVALVRNTLFDIILPSFHVHETTSGPTWTNVDNCAIYCFLMSRTSSIIFLHCVSFSNYTTNRLQSNLVYRRWILFPNGCLDKYRCSHQSVVIFNISIHRYGQNY